MASLEQELKLAKLKAATLEEQNSELQRKVEAANGSESLEAENERLRKELDGYITKKWRDFCAVQDSPTPYKKRSAYSNRGNE